MGCGRARALVLAAVVALAATACGGTSAVTVDAGPGGDGPADTAPADTGTMGCDPAAQSCGAAQKCDFGCAGTTAVVSCWPSTDGGVIGSLCSTNAMPCGRGTGCVARAGAGAATCLKYCASDGDCATGERCHNDSVGVACGAPATTLALHFCY